MFSILIWLVYGLLVGSVAKAVYPGDQNFGFWKTIALGVVGSYTGGALTYMLGITPLQPAGVVTGVIGGVVALIVYKKLT